MPAGGKVSKEAIIAAAVEPLREGTAALNARGAARKLGTQPIDLSFRSVDGLKAAVTRRAMALCPARPGMAPLPGRGGPLPPVQPPQITLTFSVVYHVDLTETWNDLKKALVQIAPKNTLLSQLLGKVLLHHISVGIHHAEILPDEKKAEELRTFLHNTADLNLGESAEEISLPMLSK